jgi:hypothetical protein
MPARLMMVEESIYPEYSEKTAFNTDARGPPSFPGASYLV